MTVLPPPPSLGTFWQRFDEQLYRCGPPSWPFLFTTYSEVQAARAAVVAGSATAADVEARQRASHSKRLLAAVCHPDTGQPIPVLLRLAAHVPVNTALLVAMLSAKTPASVAATQAANATFNLLQFYANRNASNHITSAQLFGSFALAAICSIGIGSGLRAVVDHAMKAATQGPVSSRRLYLIGAAVPFLAAAAGKPAQIGLMRNDELREGVVVFDSEDRPRGQSVIAGRTAVAQTMAVRIIYLAPMLWLPLMRDQWEARWPMLRSRPALGISTFAMVTALHSACEIRHDLHTACYLARALYCAVDETHLRHVTARALHCALTRLQHNLTLTLVHFVAFIAPSLMQMSRRFVWHCGIQARVSLRRNSSLRSMTSDSRRGHL